MIHTVFFFHSSTKSLPIVPKFQINLTSLLGRIHLFGEYIHMAFNVTKTLLKILMSFIPTFLAFTLTFNILMQSSEVFQSIHNTGFKVFVMMLGEFELTDYFTTQEVSKVGGRNFSVQVLFVLFVIFICVHLRKRSYYNMVTGNTCFILSWQVYYIYYIYYF